MVRTRITITMIMTILTITTRMTVPLTTRMGPRAITPTVQRYANWRRLFPGTVLRHGRIHRGMSV